MLVEHRGHTPVVSNSAFVASTAVVSGAVTLGDGVRVLHGAVLSAEDGEIHIEQNSIIMEHTLVRGRAGHDVRIGHSVMVGPHAHINGAVIEEGAFIATGASLFPGSVIGAGAEVRINGVVQVNTEVAAGMVVPIGWVAVGSPAQLFSPDRHDEIWEIQRTLNFVGTVYGIGPETTMPELMRQQSDYYGTHRDDRAIE